MINRRLTGDNGIVSGGSALSISSSFQDCTSPRRRPRVSARRVDLAPYAWTAAPAGTTVCYAWRRACRVDLCFGWPPVSVQRSPMVLLVVAVAHFLRAQGPTAMVLSWARLCVLMIDPWAVLGGGSGFLPGGFAVPVYISSGEIGGGDWMARWSVRKWR